MVSTPLKNICQNGNLPQMGVQEKSIWNHHPDNILVVQTCFAHTNHIQSRWMSRIVFVKSVSNNPFEKEVMKQWWLSGYFKEDEYLQNTYDIPFADRYIMVKRLGFQMLEGFRQPSSQACYWCLAALLHWSQHSIALNHTQKQLQAIEHHHCINMMSKAIHGFLQLTSIT